MADFSGITGKPKKFIKKPTKAEVKKVYKGFSGEGWKINTKLPKDKYKTPKSVEEIHGTLSGKRYNTPSYVPGTMKGKQVDTTIGPNYSNKKPMDVSGGLKVKPGNIGGSSYKVSKVPSIHKGKSISSSSMDKITELKKGTGKGNAYYPEGQAYKDRQRTKPKNINEPRRIHDATRMAQELLKRPTKLK